MPIRILIADDHRLLRAGLKSMLNADPNLVVIGEATTGEETVQAALELRPDILLLDISMPGPDGIDTLRTLVQNVPETKVLMLTMHEDGTLMQEYLQAGASGYIHKRAAESELIDAIYAVWRGMIYVHPALMRALVTQPVKEKGQKTGEAEELTAREIEVLRFIVSGYTNRQIASTLNLSVRTVETHRSNLMDKLNLHSRVDLVRYANEHKLTKPESAG